MTVTPSTPDAPAPPTPASLRRALGLRSVVSTSTGLAFAAFEYLAAAGLVAYVAGGSAWIAIGTAGLLALIAWAFFGELNGMFPTAAAIRIYMKRAINDRAGLTITFTYLTTIVLVIAADAFIVGSAVTYALGEPGWVAGAWIVVLLALAMVANLRGVQVAAGLQDVATALVLAASLAVGVAALVTSHRGLGHPLDPLHGHGHGVGGFIEAVALGIFLYSAFEWVTTSAEEVRRPVHVHRGMLIAIGILFVVCSVITMAMGHVLDHRQLSTAYPQLLLGRAALGAAGFWLMASITVVTAINTFNGAFITASRFVYGTAREGSLPRTFASLNARAVPWVPVVVIGAVSAVVALLVAASHSWEVLVAVGAALEAMIYAVAAWCTLSLRRRAPEHPRPFKVRGLKVVGAVGLVVFSVMAVVASLTVDNRFDPLPLVVIFGMALLSGAYVVAVLPKVRAAEEVRRAARPKRRPPRPASPADASATPDDSATPDGSAAPETSVVNEPSAMPDARSRPSGREVPRRQVPEPAQKPPPPQPAGQGGPC